MASTKVLKERGATVVVEIHGEALFGPNAGISRWQKRLRGRILSNAAMYAPEHNSVLRPLRPHPGPRLKDSFRVDQPPPVLTGKGGVIYSAVGSIAPYAAYVDQGTKPYMAKILPPWKSGTPTLYEHTWIPPGHVSPVGEILVKGQQGQFFMEKALKRALSSGGMRSKGVPGSSISNAIPGDVAAYEPFFPGNTAADGAFIARLDLWRSWRTDAWTNEANVRASRGWRASASREAERLQAIKEANSKRNYAREAEVRRARKQREALAAKNLRKEEGAEKKEKERAADLEAQKKAAADLALRKGNNTSKALATAYYNEIKGKIPGVNLSKTMLSDGTALWTVWWRDSSGTMHKQQWAYGYDV